MTHPDFAQSMQTTSSPRIAILIPVYNEEVVLKGTIDALLIAGAERADIYVVDDCSTDSTVAIAHSLNINIYTVPENGGKARAQVAALAYFRLLENYERIIFLDGDTKVDKNFLMVMVKAALADPTVALYLGQVKSVKNNHIFSASRAFDYTYGQDLAKTGQHNFNVVFVAPGCASMYCTNVLAQMHIDHMTLAEDMDLTLQVHRLGGRVVYLSDAIVNTQDPATFKDYHKQVLRWYRGYWQVVLKHQIFSVFKSKQRIDWYMIILSLDAIFFNRLIWLGVLSYGFGWQIAGIALGIEIAMALAIAIYVSYRTKRFDVIWKFPAYYWLNYLNLYAFLRAFVEIIILRKELLAWNKVKRYKFSDSHPTQRLDAPGHLHP